MTSAVLNTHVDAVRSSPGCLRVLLAAWAPFHAGAEVAAERLAVGLQEAGHRVTVVVGTEGETLERMIAAGVDARFVRLAFTDKMKWLRYRASQRALRKILQEVRPDVVHANDLPTSQMVGQAARRAGVPLVCHHRWIFAAEAIEWLNKFGADRHVFVSRWLMDALRSQSSGLQSSRCEVVYDGLPLPPAPTDTDRIAARSVLGLPADRRIVLFAGQVIERKGVADLIHAWPHLPASISNACDLIVVGDDLENGGQYRMQMESLASERGIPVRFVGFQRNVSDWITASDICVVPSHAEPLGNATLEAMASARAIVATAVGGIPEMIEDGDSGVLVTPHDPQSLAHGIKRLASDTSFAKELGRAARKRCEARFSIAAHVDAMVNQYQLAALHCPVALA